MIQVRNRQTPAMRGGQLAQNRQQHHRIHTARHRHQNPLPLPKQPPTENVFFDLLKQSTHTKPGRSKLFPSGIAGVQLVPELNVLLAFLPAEEDFLALENSWKINQTAI